MKILFNKYDELRSLKSLKESKYQRNKHPEDQIQRLAKIMEVEGITHPIGVSNLSGDMCFGHGRKSAALLNKWEEFPVVYIDFIDDAQEYRMVQSDNSIASWAELDLAAINLDMTKMEQFDIDLLGIKDFYIEPIEKNDNENDDENDDNKNLTICPQCGFNW